MEVAGLERDSSMAPMAHDAENPKTMKFINSSSCKDHASAAADMKNEVPDLAADQTTKRSSMEANYLNHSSISSSSSIHDQDQVLKSAKAKMGKIREENERLKTLLAKITIDYESLQAHLSNMADDHDQPNNKSVPQAGGGDPDGGGGHDEPEQLLCDLTLGRSSSRSPPGFLATADHRLSVDDGLKKKYEGQERALKLGLDSSKFEVEPADQNNIIERRGPNYNSSSSTASGTSAARDYYITKRSSCEESKEPERLSPPNTSSTKSLVIGNKTSSATGSAGEDHESDVSLLQPPLKKTRVSIRARCDAPTINDGCQWRKYGQKISKGNPCPRAYYRCTVSPTCPVRKQVQRCPEDMSILITTYEGNHNHPLPISATAIASATSAAASMLQSGSSSTTATTTNAIANNNNAIAGCFHPPTQAAAATLSAGLHGLNFAFSNDSPPGKLYFPNPTTNINSHPTITLDLTTAPNIGTATNWPLGTNASAAAAGYYSLVNPTRDFITSYYGYNPSSTSGTCLNFSSPPSSSSYQLQNATPANWGARCLNFGSMTSTSSAGAGRYDSGGVQQHPKQEGSNPSIPHVVNNQQQSSMDETISMATRAIASNPKFQSVLAAAISSYVGNKGGNAATASGTAVSRQDSGNDHQTSVEDRGHDRS